MKLRLKGNSVRFRLSKSEVELFSAKGYLEEKTNLIPESITYSLKADKDINELKASFENSRLTILVPLSLIKGWAESDTVGFEGTMRTDTENSIQILIEKDFKCLDETGEDQSDNFDNPFSVCN